jgi:Peptidase propeptide and YPEB domain
MSAAMNGGVFIRCLTAVFVGAAVQALAAPAMAQTTTDPPRFSNASDYSSAKNWFLKAETIIPHGHNPFFFPLVPGHKHILERPDHPDGHFRKETAVLDQTEPFDVPGIGKFETAIVQEEEFVDEELVQRERLWLAIDRTTNSVVAFGQVTWEIEEGKPIFTGTWRVGEPPGSTAAEPGLAMPGILAVGARYVASGSEDGPASGAETLETGIEKVVPAGTFKNCARIREQGLVAQKEITDRIWCPQVGLVADSSSGQLIASNALPPSHPGADVSSFGKYLANVRPPPVAKITPQQATETALKIMPGRMTSLVIERKRGRHVYVVEIMTSNAGEKDVLVDIESGEIVGTE